MMSKRKKFSSNLPGFLVGLKIKLSWARLTKENKTDYDLMSKEELAKIIIKELYNC